MNGPVEFLAWYSPFDRVDSLVNSEQAGSPKENL